MEINENFISEEYETLLINSINPLFEKNIYNSYEINENIINKFNLSEILEKLYNKYKIKFNNIQINEYVNNSVVNSHIDNLKYGNVVIILNLLCTANINFRKLNGFLISSNILKKRCIIKFSDKYRYKYTHSINNIKENRVVIVFRTT